MPVSISGTNGVTFPDSSLQAAAASPYVNKNRLINGAMQVWQRGTSVTTSGGYTADRWTEVSGNSNQHIQSTDAPTNFGYSMQIIGVGANMNQRIESLNCQDLSGQTITVSFWVKNTSGTDGLILALYYPNTADTFSSLTQIGSNVTISSNPSSSWTQYTTTFTSLPAGSKNGLSLYLARLGTGAVSTTWYLTGVQLEIGSSATPFERRLYNQELANCQRYYYKETSGAAYSPFGTSTQVKNTNTNYTILIKGQVPLRASPTSIDFANLAVVPFLGSANLYPVTSCSIDLSSPYVNALTLVSTSSAGSSGALVLTVANNSGSGGAYIGLNSEL